MTRTLEERLRAGPTASTDYAVHLKKYHALCDDAADALAFRDRLIKEAGEVLEGMLLYFGNPRRDEWMSNREHEQARLAEQRAREALAKLKAVSND